LSLQSPNYSDDVSYYTLRQIDHISIAGKPIIHDDLYSGERHFIMLPFYYYLMAFFNMFLPKIALKIVNNIFASLIVIAVYILAKRVIKNENIAFICSMLAALFPLYLKVTLNSLNPLSIAVPGSIFLIYLFLDIDKTLAGLIWVTIFLVLNSTTSFIMVLSVLFFIFLNYIYQRDYSKLHLEYAVFFMTFLLWVIFLLFKNNFQVHGFSLFREQLPYLGDVDLHSLMQSLGLIPLSLGMYSVYLYIVKKTNENITMIISVFFSSSVLLALKLISSETGMLFLSISLVILFGQFLKDLSINLEKSKIAARQNIIVYGIAALVFLTIIPGMFFLDKPYQNSYLAGFRWINNTPRDSAVLGLPKEGSLIAYFGGRKSVIDTQYITIDDASVRFDDVNAFYDSRFRINALRILDKYDVDYFIVSEGLEDLNLSFTLKDPCFAIAYKGEIEIYERKCDIDED
jgi:hypothetical protein